MFRRRNYKAIVRDIDTNMPCAMYDGRCFVRFDEIGPPILKQPKGTLYHCVFKGRPMELWQLMDKDYWYTEEEVEDAG